MVDENLTDEQQADVIRQWFREYGYFILGGLALGVAALFGWDQWQSGKVTRAEEASVIYEELVDKIQINNQAAADSLLAELLAGYNGSPYIELARLRLARLSLDRNDFDAAADYLESIIAESGSDEMVNNASIRLARILLQQAKYDEALAVLEPIDTVSAFSAQANNVRGDIYAAMNRKEEALAAYEAALTDSRQPPVIDRLYVQAKRDGLGIDGPVPEAEAAIEAPVESADASAAAE